MIRALREVGYDAPVLGGDSYDDPAIHEALWFLLQHLPLQMHLVIASRADPPLPIPRLRGRGWLNELYQSDLRFTSEEIGQFLDLVLGLKLSVADVAALEERTEGWIAGLQMAALSMRGRDDIPGFVRAFTGSQRYILDYLSEEVLSQQSRDVQNYLRARGENDKPFLMILSWGPPHAPYHTAPAKYRARPSLFRPGTRSGCLLKTPGWIPP